MKKLTPNEIEVTAVAVEKWFSKIFEEGETLQWPPEYHKSLRTALSTITLDQPKIDLKEVEELVISFAETEYNDQLKIESYKNHWRKLIGYTLSDLEGQENT